MRRKLTMKWEFERLVAIADVNAYKHADKAVDEHTHWSDLFVMLLADSKHVCSERQPYEKYFTGRVWMFRPRKYYNMKCLTNSYAYRGVKITWLKIRAMFVTLI